MSNQPLHESIAALDDDERAELGGTLARILDDLPTATDDPLDAGIRHSMRTVVDALIPN